MVFMKPAAEYDQASAVAHVGQHQRIGEAADAEPDGRRQRQDQDQPRGMRVRLGTVRGVQGITPAAAMWQGSGTAIAQAHGQQWCLANPRKAL